MARSGLNPQSAIGNSPGRSRWLLVISLLLAAGLLYLAFRRVDWVELWRTIRTASVGWLLLTVAVNTACYLLRALRWRVLLTAEQPVGFGTVFWSNMAGYLGNNFLPARAGEVIRSVALGRRAGISKSYVLATALTERILDVVALVTISLVAALVLGSSGAGSAELVRAFRIMGIVGVLGLAFVIFAPRGEKLLRRLVVRLPGAGKLDGMLTQFLLGLRALGSPGRVARFAALTAVIWLGDGLASVVVARALHLSLNLPQALLLLAALGLSSALPATPGYVGVFQFVAVTVLMPFDFTRSEALAFILVVQALNYVLVLVLGLFGLGRLGLGKLSRIGASDEPASAVESVSSD